MADLDSFFCISNLPNHAPKPPENVGQMMDVKLPQKGIGNHARITSLLAALILTTSADAQLDSSCCGGQASQSDAASTVTSVEPVSESSQDPAPVSSVNKGLRILFLGDSMSIGGFGVRLDSQLRKMPGVATVNTYLCCGTSPLSWLKKKPFTNVQTRCGYWSIESSAAGASPEVLKDVYGMRKGHRPSAHRVPKLDDLMQRHRPNVLIFQSGNNLFSCFKDRKTIDESSHSKALSWYLSPFIDEVTKPGTSLKKFYWITPPEAGSVSEEIQAFVFAQIQQIAGPVAEVIDSRALTTYPYKLMGPDKEHFWGAEADQWSDDVFKIISTDLASQSLKELVSLDQSYPSAMDEAKHKTDSKSTKLIARLTETTAIPAPASFAPYEELLIAY
ncbi:MAG: hypothetical protein ACO3RV_06565, partial [Luteolibacter sp.]